MRRVTSMVAALVVIASLTGCIGFGGAQGGSIEIQSVGNRPVRLMPGEAGFKTAIYRFVDKNTVTVVLSDIDAGALARGEIGSGLVVCMDMFLTPKAGSTPIDPTATNCTVRQIVFANDAVGVYGGAGFLLPDGKIGKSTFKAKMLNSTIQPIRVSEGFADRLGPAELSGRLSAARDDAAVDDIAVMLNTEVSRRLGRVFFVMGR